MKFRNEFETNIEKKLREELESRGYALGVDFATQYAIRYGHILDLAFPDKKIAIEADGEPWHTPEKDAKKNAVLRKKGWKVIRFSGTKIMEDARGCIDEVLELYNKS